MLTWLALPALALEVDPHGRWVEDVEAAAGVARAELRGGVSFPLTHEGLTVGFVYVGETSLTVPVATSGEALAIRAGLPELSLTAGERWTERGEVLLAIGLREEVLAAAMAGHPLTGGDRTIAFVDDQGREQVLVTALTPRAALERARATLRDRTRALTAARLDPSAMLGREVFRDGERRAIVELRSEHDLGPLIGAIDDSADLARTWMTWVVDPSGLVDRDRGQILAVHGQGAQGHPFRVLSGVPRRGEPEWTAIGGEANVVLDRPIGTAALAHTEVHLALRAGGGGRWVDLWVPHTVTTTTRGQIPVTGDPVITRATTSDGATLVPVRLPFGGQRATADWIVASWLLPEDADPGEVVDVRLDWEERWDVSGILQLGGDTSASYLTLGRVTAGLPVLPVVPTGPERYPAEVRAGTLVPGYQMSVGSGAVGRPWGDGRLWVAQVDGPTTITAGALHETLEDGHGGFPAVRLLQGAFPDKHLAQHIRSVLNFYGTTLPTFPFRQVVFARGQDHPVSDATPFDPSIPPRVTYAGQGQLVFEGVRAIGRPGLERQLEVTFPRAAERDLAEALAAGWFAELPWPERDRWLGRAIPMVLRDRFVEEAWGEKVARPWEVVTEQRLSREAPRDGLQSLVGTEAWWADETGARFLGRTIAARIGERSLLEGLARLQASEDPSLDRLVAELESVSKVPLRDSFDVFVVAGLRPAVDGTWERDGDELRVRLTADVPLGTWEVPVVATTRHGEVTAWVRLVDGVGEGLLTAEEVVDVAIDPDHRMPLRRRGILRQTSTVDG
ncbi:MAG: hypothetical protein H6738_15005 [Alphaproteobacteria bacterium]|nr:hypothetical protein [Alphaproteobacteria bacterium]MCB9698086.1 hypothetical protein [Alphaproteobacteria bacterium]